MAKSKIEILIDELEDYIDDCKPQLMSNTKIVVEKEHLIGYINELRKTTPEELAKYQKVVSNREAILKDAREKADALINEAAVQTSEMVNQNSIMKQAYAQADEVVKSAYIQAQEILTTATLEANELRTSAVDYLDNQLAQYENVVAKTLNLTQGHCESFLSQLNEFYNIVLENRNQLRPPMTDTMEMSGEYAEGINDANAVNVDPTTVTGPIPGQVTGPIGQTTGPIGTQVTGPIPSQVTGPLDAQSTGDLKLM